MLVSPQRATWLGTCRR
uniref:Uncharacterized protein n=1 Tax=Arundo donax TaxID=35708 RepID=A0A0A8Z0W7_ARUDO